MLPSKKAHLSCEGKSNPSLNPPCQTFGSTLPWTHPSGAPVSTANLKPTPSAPISPIPDMHFTSSATSPT